jgi:hypothetical protein
MADRYLIGAGLKKYRVRSTSPVKTAKIYNLKERRHKEIDISNSSV